MSKIDTFQAVLFDLDGTITNPQEGIINSIIYAAKQFDIKDSNEKGELDTFIGPPLHQSFQKRYHVSEEVSFEMVKEYRVYYAKKGIFECYIYDGIAETIEYLYQHDIFLSLATSKPVGFANQLLDYFGLDKYFSFTAGALMDGKRTDKKDVIQFALDNIPSFEKENILMIGDREFDILGGKHHGLQTAWAKWGFGTEAEILPLKPDYIYSSASKMIL